MPRKRARDEAELDNSFTQIEDHNDEETRETLDRLRNMWQFASLMQFIHFFGSIIKIDDDLDIEELEDACTRPDKSFKLAQIGLAMLKYVSSHRGLTPELFDEYTRRQYTAKAPQRNPFGEDEDPQKFEEFDVYTKIRVLQQLSTWTLGNAERIRSQMPEKDSEQTQWRIEPFGWDTDDRVYFLLDDDRLYRQTEPPPPPPPTKAKTRPKSKKARGTRASKRRKVSAVESDVDDDVDADADVDDTVVKTEDKAATEDDGFGGMKWECIAVTMPEYQEFLETIRRSKDPNEKRLYKAINESIVPVMEKKAEAQRQKALRKQRELENLQKLATAKRSSRLAGKMEKQKAEEEAAAAESKRLAELEMAHKQQDRQRKMEEDRETRMMTREQRLKEREMKRILHEEELAKLEEMAKSGDDADGRHSERHLKSQLERRQKELEELKQEEERWIFDCSVCGMHGENLDDGTHSIACERCNIWQHSKCHGIKEADAERDDFHFICADCKRKEEDAKKPRIPPLKLGRVAPSPSPQTDRSEDRPSSNGISHDAAFPQGRTVTGVAVPKRSDEVRESPQPRHHNGLMDGPSLSPHGQSHGPPGYRPTGPAPIGVPQPVWHGSPLPPPQRPTPASASSSPQPASAQPGPYPQPSGHQPSPPLQLHQQAHASAVASSHTPHYGTNQFSNAPTDRSMPPPSPHRHSRPSSSNNSTQQPLSAHGMNGLTASPSKPRQPVSPSQAAPNGAQQSPHNDHLGAIRQSPLFQGPGTSFPPPNYQQHDRYAGHSPIKQPSPSPYQSQPSPRMSQTPSAAPQTTAVTPSSHIAPLASTPMSNILRPSSHLTSSPIPPVGNGPVIPTKHDTPRPTTRDSIGETPVFPPTLALSPSSSQTQNGRGMGTESGEGGLGTSNIPVKKMPGQSSQSFETPSSVSQAQTEARDVVMEDS